MWLYVFHLLSRILTRILRAKTNLKALLVAPDTHERECRENAERRAKGEDAHEGTRGKDAEGAQECHETPGAEGSVERKRRVPPANRKVIGISAALLLSLALLLLFDRIGWVFDVVRHGLLLCNLLIDCWER